MKICSGKDIRLCQQLLDSNKNGFLFVYERNYL